MQVTYFLCSQCSVPVFTVTYFLRSKFTSGFIIFLTFPQETPKVRYYSHIYIYIYT
jgi:hypothetical protein